MRIRTMLNAARIIDREVGNGSDFAYGRSGIYSAAVILFLGVIFGIISAVLICSGGMGVFAVPMVIVTAVLILYGAYCLHDRLKNR